MRGLNREKKKGRAESPPCLAERLELLAAGHFLKLIVDGLVGLLPNGQGRLLLKFWSLVASARIVALSQEASAVLTSEMTCAVVSG